MTTRRILEMWNDNRSIEFRTRLAGTSGDDVSMIIRTVDRDWTLNGPAVEELHHFTYEILAGRHGDPRLDAEIMCGAQADSLHDGHLECALPDGHRRVGDFDHVNRRGIVFDTPGAF